MTPKILAGAAALALTGAVVLASGAVAMADSYYGYGYAPPGYGYQFEPYGYAAAPDAAWCAQRYRSFNPATGMYLGYDGRQHVCRGPVADQGSAFGYAPQPYPYAAPVGAGRPLGTLPRDRVVSPGRGDPGHTWQNATTEPF
jgi:hypothetical protein